MLLKKKTEMNKCVDCGTKISEWGTRCNSCAGKLKVLKDNCGFKKGIQNNKVNPWKKGVIPKNAVLFKKGGHPGIEFKEGDHLGKNNFNFGKDHSGERNPNWKGGKKASIGRANAKRKGFGFYRISFGFNGCVWHHVTKQNVVAISEEIHGKIKHSLSGKYGIFAVRLEGVLG